MSLLKPKYNKLKKLQWDKKCIIEGLEELGENRYFFEDVGLWQKGEYFKTKTHLLVFDKSDEGYKYACIPVFKIELSGNEDIENFSVYYDINNAVRIELTCWKGEEKTWYFAEENGPKDEYGAIGTKCPGKVDIIIEEKDKLDETIRKELWICPSSLNREQFNQMLSDISTISYNVIRLAKIGDAKSYLGSDWKRELQEIQKKLEKMYPWLDRIKNSPRGNLKNCKKWLPYSKIRIINSSVVRQYLMDCSRSKYLVDATEYMTDIYEHRIFYSSLVSLKENVSNLTKKWLQIQRQQIADIQTLRRDGEDEVRIKELEKKNEEIERIIICVKNIAKKIDDTLIKYLKLSLFNGIMKTDEAWRITQILTNDFRYYQMYKILKSMDSIATLPLVSDWRKVFIEKTDKIYEVWVLSKIIELLKQQNWFLKQGNNTENDITKIYEKFIFGKVYKEKQEWTLSGTVEHIAAGLEMDIFYNVPVVISLQDLIIKKIALRPDFLFRVRKKTEEGAPASDEKIFILDAKYRNYGTQWMGKMSAAGEKGKNLYEEINNMERDEVYWLFEDVESVAYEKYIYRMKQETGVDVSAAFIVHTDNRSKDTKQDNNGDYTGTYVTYNATSDTRWETYLNGDNRKRLKEAEEESKSKRKKEYFKKQDDYEPDKIDASTQQIGAFFMVPEENNTKNTEEENVKKDESSENLKTFFAMVFEYYMGVTNICWNCGRMHDADKDDYYCKCGHYWKVTHCFNHKNHKLIKHWNKINNYHIIQRSTGNNERKAINVICPICGEALN